jgi:hypothetical protein
MIEAETENKEWVEGHVEHVTGWAIGDDQEGPKDPPQEADSL